MPQPTPPATSIEADPLGHDLLRQRLAAVPAYLGELIETPVGLLPERLRTVRHFVVAGTGSSEAHARFLVHLLNRTERYTAEFRPLSAFCLRDREAGRDRALVVVSQGLSPNARVAFAQRSSFDATLVFTATTAAGARSAGKAELAGFIEQLESENVVFLRSPLEEEYSTLLRFVGPMVTFLRAWQFVRALEGGSLPRIEASTVQPWLNSRLPADTIRFFESNVPSLRRGFYLIAGSPVCEFAQNLAYKFLEGVFWSAPMIWDFLQFAHGPFQEVTLQPRPVVILEGPGEVDRDLAARTRSMLQSAAIPSVAIRSTSAGPEAIFEYEALFNELIMRLITGLQIDQRNWPSKGKDDPLYGFHRLG